MRFNLLQCLFNLNLLVPLLWHGFGLCAPQFDKCFVRWENKNRSKSKERPTHSHTYLLNSTNLLALCSGSQELKVCNRSWFKCTHLYTLWIYIEFMGEWVVVCLVKVIIFGNRFNSYTHHITVLTISEHFKR